MRPITQRESKQQENTMLALSTISRHDTSYLLPSSKLTYARQLSMPLVDRTVSFESPDLSVPSNCFSEMLDQKNNAYGPLIHNKIVAKEISVFGLTSFLSLNSIIYSAFSGKNISGYPDSEIYAFKALIDDPAMLSSNLPDIITNHKPAFIAFSAYLLSQEPINGDRIKEVHDIARANNEKTPIDYEQNHWQYEGVDTVITMLGDKVFELEDPKRYEEISLLLERQTNVPKELRNCLPCIKRKISETLLVSAQKQRLPEQQLRGYNIVVGAKSPSSLRNCEAAEILKRNDLLRMRILVPTVNDVKAIFEYFSGVTYRPFDKKEATLPYITLRLLRVFGFPIPKKLLAPQPSYSYISRRFTYLQNGTDVKFDHMNESVYKDYHDAIDAIADVTEPLETANSITVGMFYIYILDSIAKLPLEIQILAKTNGPITSKCLTWWARIKAQLS